MSKSMSKNKIVACMLGTMLLLGNTMPILGSDGEWPILTLDKAITKAREVSREISYQQRKQEYLSDSEDSALNMGSYGGYLSYSTDRQYAAKKESLEKEQIAIKISKLFDEIIVAEKELVLAEKKISLQDKEIKKQELMKQKGMSNELNLEGVKLSYEQLVDNKKKLEDTIETKYSELCSAIGSRTQKYTLEKEENVFEPYIFEGSADSIAERRTKEHMDVWKAEKQINVVEASFMGGTYEEYLVYKSRKEDAQYASQNIADSTESYIREMYVQLRQLEQQYDLLAKEIALKEKEVLVNKSYLDKGLVSQVAYDKIVIAYEDAQVSLQKLINNHTYLKKQLNNPNLAKMGM